MTFDELGVQGAFVLRPDPIADERGLFARIFSAPELAERGLDSTVAECSVAYNPRAATLRGLHFQLPPHEETKTVRCARGAAFDVVVDLRPESPTFLAWDAVELTDRNRLSIYIPKGCAHGYLTLEDDTELTYTISTAYAADAAAGVRWSDPTFAIAWPRSPEVISERDASFADFRPSGGGLV